MEQTGPVSTVTTSSQVTLPSLVVITTLSVNDPPAPVFTITEDAFVGPAKLAPDVLADRDQAYVAPAMMFAVYVCVVPAHREAGPLTRHVSTAPAESDRSWLPPEPSRAMRRV